FGDDGCTWLVALPDLINQASHRWGLTNVQPVSNLSYNFVAFAKRLNEDVVLKIGVPNSELVSEISALRFFDGKGAVRLLEADEERAMFLLERLRPGEMLATLSDDDHATHIAADVMLRLWHTPPKNIPFIKLTDWFNELNKLRPAFNGGTGPFPKKLIEEVEETLPRLFVESELPMLIHGDLHHYNILSSGDNWLAIDPKGVIGHPEYEVGPFLINPFPNFLNGSQPKVQIEKRIAIFSERLGFPRQRLRDWGMCHAVLSAWWNMAPDGTGGEYSMHCAEIISQT
ncbi:MAG TPA: aminoglycoside phosphotransferase family protein, partial [Anaerolineales bacterium]